MVSDQTMNLKYKNRVLCPSRQNSTFFFLTLRCVDDTKRSFTSENGTMTEISSNMKNSICHFRNEDGLGKVAPGYLVAMDP